MTYPPVVTEDARPEHHPAPPAPRHGRQRLAGLVMAVAMLAAGIGIGWLVFSPPADAPEIEALAQPGEEPDAAAAPVTPAETADELLTGEPVADVAATLLPSVVQIEAPTGIGSGVIYESDGLILTADHVVAGTDQVRVRLSDGRVFSGEVLGGVPDADVAVVRVDATDLPAADLALETEVRVGQMAVAIGSPFGFNSTVTSGVVSAVNQAVGAPGSARSLIQTDAAINPGNSGGALADREGRVIGINVSIFSVSGGNQGVGFAVPIGVAIDLAESIVSGEPIETAVLGVVGTNADGEASGALITEVAPGSGAAEAGLEIGDIVVAIDGVPIQGIADLGAQVRSYRPSDTVTLLVLRLDEQVELIATLGSAD